MKSSDENIHKLFDSYPDTQTNTGTDAKEKFDSIADVDALEEVPHDEGSTFSDALLGSAQGLTLGGADELEGAVLAGKEKLLGDSKEDLYDLYRKYQKSAEERYKQAYERSPAAYTTGNVVGSIAPALGTGGAGLAARAGLKGAARVGAAAAEGAALGGLSAGLTSEKTLDTAESAKDLASDIATGAALGGTLSGGLASTGSALSGIKKSVEKGVEENPFLRQQVKLPFTLGKEGKNIAKESVQSELMQNPSKAAQDMLTRIKTVDKQLGKAVGDSIESATQSGKKLNFGQDLLGSFSELQEYAAKNPDIALEKLAKKTYGYLKNKGKEVSPIEAKQILSEMADIQDSLQGETGPAASFLRGQISKITKSIDTQLKSEIPDYATAAQRFSEFRRMVPETIMSKETPQSIAGTSVSSLKNADKKIFSSIKDTLEGSGREGSGFFDSKLAMENIKKGLQGFEKSEADRLAAGVIDEPVRGLNAEETIKRLRGVSDESSMLQAAAGVTGHEGIQSGAMKGAFGLAKAGKGAVALGVNKAGLVAGSKPVKLAQDMYKLPAEALTDVAQTLKGQKGLEFLGSALEKGIQNGDRSKQNAAIFSILQNPDARKLFIAEDTEE